MPHSYRFGLKRCEPPPVVTNSTYPRRDSALPSEWIRRTAPHWARWASALLNGDSFAQADRNRPRAPTWRLHAACHVARLHAACDAVRGVVTALRGGPMPGEARSGSRRGSLCRTRSSPCRTCAHVGGKARAVPAWMSVGGMRARRGCAIHAVRRGPWKGLSAHMMRRTRIIVITLTL